MSKNKSVRLSTEIVSLVHNIELHRSGWWEKVLERIICAAIWISDEPQSPNGVSIILGESFHIHLEPDKLFALTEKLLSENTLIKLSDGRLGLSETARHQIELNLAQTEDLEGKVKQRLKDSLDKQNLSLDVEVVWRAFYQDLLFPLVKELGARTYELVSGLDVELNGNLYIEGFLEKYSLANRDALKRAIIEFLNGKDSKVRAYVLHLLNSVFILEASHLSTSSIETISAKLTERAAFNIIVDTNVLFAMLGLDETSSSEAANYLLQLPKETSNSLNVKFLVLPITLEEAKRKLIAERGSLKGIRSTLNVSNAATRHGIGLNGIVLKYFDVARSAKYQITPEEYFDPYINNLTSIVMGKNIEILDVDTNKYKEDQRVITETGREEYDQSSRLGIRQKTHSSIEHDAVLWYFALDQRATKSTSLAGTHFWITTIDRRFVRNDAYRCRQIDHHSPICIFPAVLIQMLQLWIPRSPELEEAVIGSLRPLLSAEFNSESEQATIAILKSLSRFEDVGDLPEESIADVLVNESLRSRLQSVEEVEDDQQFEWVRDVLIQEGKKVREQLEAEKHEKDVLLHDLQREKASKEQVLNTLQMEEERRAVLEERINLLEQQRQMQKLEQETKQKRNHFAIRFLVLLPLLFVFLSVAIVWVLDVIATSLQISVISYSRVFAGIFSLSLVLWLIIADRNGVNEPAVSTWRPYMLIHSWKNWLLGVLITGVLINAVWDFVKTLFLLQ